MATHLNFQASCPECGFSSADVALLNNHSCTVQENGGRCEDYPCCGHERGDCNGQRYGSDEAIMDQWMRAMDDPELMDRLERQAEYDAYYG